MLLFLVLCSQIVHHYYLPDISKWNTNKVTHIGCIFANCSSLSSLPNISKWNTNTVIDMSLMFYNCSSLSSLPDISKWNTDKVVGVVLMFTKCTSLISMPNISKWKTKNLKIMKGLFSDCDLLLDIPDISKWNNYKENDLYEKPDYEIMEKILNFSEDIHISSPSLDYEEIFNNFEFWKKQTLDKIDKFL